MGYSGWTNYQTWNVALWAGGDEGLYRAKEDLISSLDGPVQVGHVAAFVADWMGGCTPDVPLRDMHHVNYVEIAAAWEDDRQEGL